MVLRCAAVGSYIGAGAGLAFAEVTIMSRNTIRMLGHGVDLTVDARDWSGLPMYCTTPARIRTAIEHAFRSVLADAGGGVAYQSRRTRCRQVEKHLFVHAQAITLSLYKIGTDGVSREDKATRRTFRFYTRQDWRDDFAWEQTG